MVNVGDTYVIDLDELFEMNGGDRIMRVLPSIDGGDDIWWRYLTDDDEGAFCLYTYDEVDGDPLAPTDNAIWDSIEKNGLYPSAFGGSLVDVIALFDEDLVLFRMQTEDGSSYTKDGLYIPDFLLNTEEVERCCTPA